MDVLTLKGKGAESGRCTHCMTGVEVLAGPHMILLVGSIEGMRIPLRAAPFLIQTYNLVDSQHDFNFHIHVINCNATTPSHIDPNAANLILQTPWLSNEMTVSSTGYTLPLASFFARQHSLSYSSLSELSPPLTQTVRSPYFLTGPLTPAPMTLGNSSLPIEYIMPIIVEMRKASMTPVPTNNQKGVEMSFFWQAGPPQLVTLRALPLPTMVGEQAQPKRSCWVLS